MIDNVKLGQRIREIRKRNNLTIAQLAETVGISDNFMGNIERAVDTPSIETIVKIANALFVPLDELLYDSLEYHTSYTLAHNRTDHEINKHISGMSSIQKQQFLKFIEVLQDFNTTS